MRQYHDLVRHILERGVAKNDRTGTGTLSVFGHQARYDLRNACGEEGPPTPESGFPLLTTKKLHARSIVEELIWFVRGDTNKNWLNERGVSIWDEWADADGELGPIYGRQWRRWPAPDGTEIDQLEAVVESLRNTPHSRRHIVSAWNVGQIPEMALPPCHCLFQFDVSPDPDGGTERLSCQLYQRSADVFLGVPFNIASYALLTVLLARICGYRPGEFIHTLGDAHLYVNHLDQARELLTREPRPLPTLNLPAGLKSLAALKEWGYGDDLIRGYDPHPHIAAPVAV